MARKRKNKFVVAINWTALIVMLLGAITWGTIGLPQLFGFAGFNLISVLFSAPMIVNGLYSLIGISTVWMMFNGLFTKLMK